MKQLKLPVFIVCFLLVAVSSFAQAVITPSNPGDNDNLVCSFSNQGSFIYRWYSGSTKLADGKTLSSSLTSPLQTYTCKVYIPPTRYTGIAVVGEASVTIAATPISPPPLNVPPKCNFTSNAPRNEGDNVNFTDLSTDNNGNIVSWSWDFGDGQISILKNPLHIYSQNGTYEVILTVTDNDGASDSFSSMIQINDLSPKANFTVSSYMVAVNQTVTFRDLSMSVVDALSWLWDFKDGTTKNTQNAVHQFKTPGLYNVTLVVTDSDGSIDSAYREIIVYNPNVHGTVYDTDYDDTPVPGANISFYSDSQCRLDELYLNESGDCNLEPKQLPETVTDSDGNYWAWLPSGTYHMVVQHSKQVEKNIKVNNSNQKIDTELKENQIDKNVNFEGHIQLSSNYRNGNKYVAGDPLSFVMFGNNQGSSPVTVSYMIEHHDTGNVGPWVYNGSFVSETLTVPAHSVRIQKQFNITLPGNLVIGKYDIHVLYDNVGTLEKWHKIGNFFVVDRATEVIESNSPIVRFRTGLSDTSLGNTTAVADYVNETMNLTFNVKIPSLNNTIPSVVIAQVHSTVVSSSRCKLISGSGDEIIMIAPNAFITINGTTKYEIFKINATNIYGDGCFIDSKLRYEKSNHFKVNITAKDQYSGKTAQIRTANTTAWATEEMARNIYYDITEQTLDRSGRPYPLNQVDFTGYYAGDRNPYVGAGGYGANNNFNVIKTNDSMPSYFYLSTDVFDTQWGFEYRSKQEGYDAGTLNFPAGNPVPCKSESTALLSGLTNCERDGLNVRWQTLVNPYILVVDPMTSDEIAKNVTYFGDYMVSKGSSYNP